MKRVLMILVACMVCVYANAHNLEDQMAAENVVRAFFESVSNWFQCEKNKNSYTNTTECRNKIIDLTTGVNTKVNDKIIELQGEKSERFGGHLGGWLSFFDHDIVNSGCSLTINSIRYECEEPRLTTVGGGSWVYADVTIRYDNKSVRINDYLRVFNGKICTIDREGSELNKAIKLYNNKRYDEAFPIFLKISEEKTNEFEAQYYAVVMLTLKQGCKHLSKDTRINYAVKYTYNAYRVNFNRPLAELYLKYYYTKEP